MPNEQPLTMERFRAIMAEHGSTMEGIQQRQHAREQAELAQAETGIEVTPDQWLENQDFQPELPPKPRHTGHAEVGLLAGAVAIFGVALSPSSRLRR